MEIIPLDSLQSTLPEDGWRRLQAFIGTVSEGQPENLVTPFFPKEWRNDERGYAEWIYRNIAHSPYEEFNELEEEEVKLFGPFSIRANWSTRRQGAEEYFQCVDEDTPDNLGIAMARMARWITPHSLVPLQFKTSFGAMPKDSNLGLPWFTKDKSFADYYLDRANELLRSGFDFDIEPAVVGWRGQASGDPDMPKQRVVFMEDHLETIVGLSIQVPLLERLRGMSEFAAWNELSVVDKVVTQTIDRARVPIWSADFSGFDKHQMSKCIVSAFDLIRLWFVVTAKPQIDWLERQILTVGLVTPDGIYTGRSCNMPSGSALTNLVDSLVQLLMVYGFTSGRGSVLGDDGFYYDERGLDVDVMSMLLYESYSAKVSADKGGFSKDSVKYLQRLHLRRYRVHGICVGVRSLVRTWNGVCHLERGHKDLPPEFFSARAIMQLENCKWHPRFRKLVEYFFSLDTFSQNLDPSEIFVRAGGVEKVEKVMNLQSFRFGQELPSSGLNNFQTVQILRKMRSGRKAT